MGFRTDLVSAVLARVAALALTGTPTTGVWAGEDAAFNPAAATPSVWVHLGPVGCGDDLEGGAAVTYARTASVHVYVCTATDTHAGIDGHAQALALLDELETGLSGAVLSTGAATGLLTLVAEDPAPPHLGRYLWLQQYRIDNLVSR